MQESLWELGPLKGLMLRLISAAAAANFKTDNLQYGVRRPVERRIKVAAIWCVGLPKYELPDSA